MLRSFKTPPAPWRSVTGMRLIALRRAAARAIVFALLGPALAATASAQSAETSTWKEIAITSRVLGPRKVYVSTPYGYDRTTARYAVLVLLDANDDQQFHLGVAQAAYLADNDQSVPPMIVVGIANGDDRIHDMTPPATGSSVAGFKTAGGASAFADFILGEVLPMVRARYRTLPTTILGGHSAGGLFALDVAANRPGSFQGIVAMDPAIWFNDEALVTRYADAIAKAPARQRIFVGHGGVPSDADIDTASQHFVARLGAIKPPRVALFERRYAADTHALVPLDALSDGLRFVFAPVSTWLLPISSLDARADSATVMRAVAASEAMYADSARTLLLPEEVPEAALVRGARFLVNTVKNPRLAVVVLKRNVALHPNSSDALTRQAGGYLAAGDTASAIENLRKAVALAPSSETELPDNAVETLRKLEQRKPK